MGSTLWIGAVLQQIALIYTEIANVAFLTILYVPIVPLLSYFFSKNKIPRVIFISIIFCIIGTWCLVAEELKLGYLGDLIAMIGAIFWSLHIILISKSAEYNLEPVMTAGLHILFAGLIGLIVALFIEEFNLYSINESLFELIYTGILSIGIGFTLQTIAQSYSPPAHAALVLSMEGVFAAIAAYIILDQVLGYYSILGCFFIIIGVLISELSKK